MATQKINFHTHTNFCDGKNTAEEMVLSAIQKGFTVLGFSSHSVYPLSSTFYSNYEKCWHIPDADIAAYVKEIRTLAEKYAEKIKILLGFEADYISNPKYGEALPDIAAYSKFAPDYLIGSTHFVINEKGLYTVDNSTEIVEQSLKKLYTAPDSGKIDGKTAVCEYYETQRQMLEKGNFNIWGHPDLIRKRNGLLQFFNESESWYKEELKLTAKAAAKTGVVAEVNTGALARGIKDVIYPSDYFLSLLYDAKVPVCINSDSHDVNTIDFAFDRATELVKKTGYKELIYPYSGGEYVIKL